MSLVSGVPGVRIIMNNLTPSTVDALSKSSAETADERLGLDDKTVFVNLSKAVERESEAAKGKGLSRAVKELLKRMNELQQQLREQQQQLAAAQAASYPTQDARTAVVMSIQGQIGDTNGAIAEVASALVEALSAGSTSSSLVDTTA
ncbi:hypothetical protein [Pseudomonas fluorescens]|uniref:hypothetical protein n=1 Tax=Pseudomonas fluorescens TaxID=294 RepID=UPI00123FEF07|nr:hypothetical protein [Pseudomonas fluorescens]